MNPRLHVTPLEDRLTPATLRVNSLLDNTIAGDGQVTLREAIIAANNNSTTDLSETGNGADTILFVGPAVGGTISLSSAAVSGQVGLPSINSDITIHGGTADARVRLTRAYGVGDFRLIRVGAVGALTMRYLNIESGVPDSEASPSAGGIHVENGGYLLAERCSFTRNISGNASDGGAIHNAGKVDIDNCVFDQNRGRNGGALYNRYLANVSYSLFTGNSAASDSANLNFARGGAIANVGTSLYLDASTLTGNTSQFGAGLYSNSDTNIVTGCTFANNTAWYFNLSVMLYEGGGGIYLDKRYVAGTTISTDPGLEMTSTILSGNWEGGRRSDLRVDQFASSSGLTGSRNLLSTPANGYQNGVQGNIVGVDPLLQPLANNGGLTLTHALSQNSPALGAGGRMRPNGMLLSPFDQRGTARDAVAPDIGAYEVQHPLAPVGSPTSLDKLYSPKPSNNANEAFLKGLYQSTLRRDPDSVGFSNWLSLMNSGTPRDTIANGFVNSIENRSNQVTFYYRYFLNRSPDAAGQTFWVNTLRGGTDEGTVMTNFILSPEFSASNTNTQFVNLMYYATLGRIADTAGLNSWVAQLNSGTSRATVVNGFLRSPESLNRVIDSYFQTYLQRRADAGGLSAYTTFLQTRTFGQAAISILAGAEFYNNAAANL